MFVNRQATAKFQRAKIMTQSLIFKETITSDGNICFSAGKQGGKHILTKSDSERQRSYVISKSRQK